MNIVGLLQSILGGLGTGTVYALLGLSFALIFGRLQICSVLHGDLAGLGAYLAYAAFTFLGLDPFITMIILLPIFYFLGYGVQSVFMKPFMKLDTWKGRYQGQVMVSWGLGMSVMALEYIIFSGTYKTLNVPYRNNVIRLGEITIPILHIVALAITLLLLLGMNILLKKTSLGIEIRACSTDTFTAKLTGINVDKVCAVTFGLSASIAAIAGVIFSLLTQLSPAHGFELTFLGWCAVILGTMGYMEGAVWAGLIMGVIESVTSYVWIPALSTAMIYIVLVLVLVFSPYGLFANKRNGRRKKA